MTQDDDSQPSDKFLNIHKYKCRYLLYQQRTKTYKLMNEYTGKEFHYDTTFSDFLDVMDIVER